MKRKIKPGAKIVIAALIVALAFFAKWLFIDSEYIFKKDVKQTVEVNNVVLPDAPRDMKGDTIQFRGLPTSEIASVNAPRINMEIMAWNSQMGLIYANGGAQTTKGSIMEKNNVNLSIKRQDDCNQMAADLIKFASDYKNNPSTASGTNFIAIMGDGALLGWLALIMNLLN